MEKIWVDYENCTGCRTCEHACAIERDSVGGTLWKAVREDCVPVSRVKVQGVGDACYPLQCRQCQDAACLKACRTGAIYRDERMGTVLLDASKCVGCWLCIKSCPYHAIRKREQFKVAIKCDGCSHMASSRCVDSCPTGALMRCTEEEYWAYLADKHGDGEAWGCPTCGYVKDGSAAEKFHCPVCGQDGGEFHRIS